MKGIITMKGLVWGAALTTLALSHNGMAQVDPNYPHATIANDQVRMTLYLPDAEHGYYRGMRFDWSGVIASATYRGHEYFGPWRTEHDALRHDSITGPVEGYIAPGPGYEEAKPGEAFLRIGVGALIKPADDVYHFRNIYEFVRHDPWIVEQGGDWISFQHQAETDLGYAYRYTKTIQLTDSGFEMHHRLENRGSKLIETDQFNHNFFVIDGTPTGAGFEVEFPFVPTTGNDLRNRAEIDGKIIRLTASHQEQGIRLEVEGFSDQVSDHHITLRNRNTGAGVTYSIDQPLTEMVFWTNPRTLSPENFIQISAAPGESMEWTSTYNFFVE